MNTKYSVQKVLDAHCDTVHYFTGVKGPYDFLQKNNIAQIDLPRMEGGGIAAQIFALFIEPQYKPDGALRRCLYLLDLFYRTIEPCKDRLEVVHNSHELQKANNKGKIAALLSVEGGEALEGEIAVLRMLFRLGIRSLGLTWNERNQIADGVGEREAGGGLTRFGKAVIKEMNNLGMIIDLAHITEKGFNDVLKITSAPVIVSHANAKKICNHPRNLTDEQLKALSENGGVVGVSFYPVFIHSQNPEMEILLDHFVHIAEVAGIEHLGIGSDFDGMQGRELQCMKDVSCLPSLIEGLHSRGFKEDDLQKILFGNFFRVIKEVCK